MSVSSAKNNSYLYLFVFDTVQVGSYSYDMAKMVFTQTNKVQGYVKTAHSVVLDYAVRQQIHLEFTNLKLLSEEFDLHLTFT